MGALGIKDGAGVVHVEQRLQERYRDGPGQGGQTLAESRQLSAGHREGESGWRLHEMTKRFVT